jgi:hypothetical protein
MPVPTLHRNLSWHRPPFYKFASRTRKCPQVQGMIICYRKSFSWLTLVSLVDHLYFSFEREYAFDAQTAGALQIDAPRVDFILGFGSKTDHIRRIIRRGLSSPDRVAACQAFQPRLATRLIQSQTRLISRVDSPVALGRGTTYETVAGFRVVGLGGGSDTDSFHNPRQFKNGASEDPV